MTPIPSDATDLRLLSMEQSINTLRERVTRLEVKMNAITWLAASASGASILTLITLLLTHIL
jgi:hypothetical protein